MITEGDQSKYNQFLLDVCRGRDLVAYVTDSFPCGSDVRSLTACRVLQEYNVTGITVSTIINLRLLGNLHRFVSISTIKWRVCFISFGGSWSRLEKTEREHEFRA